MRRVALAFTWGIVFVGLAFAGPATPVVFGHAQLVTSDPAAGTVVAESPAELRLVFSEPIDPTYTRFDLLDPDGAVVGHGLGAMDATDPYSLVATIDPLSDGVYTVDWRSLSAADGHSASGFFTFGVGNVEGAGPHGMAMGAGGVHAHDTGTAIIEAEARIVGDLGFLLALGLAVIAALVLREVPEQMPRLVAACLVMAAVGAAGLLWAGGSAAGLDPVSYATASRTGLLLGARLALGVGAGIVVALLGRARPGLAVGVGGATGLLGVTFVAAGGHAAAYASWAPMAAIVVHLLGIAVWLSGLIVLVWIAWNGREGSEPIGVVISRFSGLALVAVALLVATGLYSDWIQTRALISLDTQYGTTLAIKIAVVLGALAIGARNYLQGGRPGDGGFRVRVAAECALALAAVAITGALAGASPPAPELPIRIAEAPSSAGAGGSATLELAPGRPGPNRFLVTLPAAGAGGAAELRLQRLDSTLATTMALATTGNANQFAASGGSLPAGSRWDATVVVRGGDGQERSRTRFTFALDNASVAEGRAAPALDPGLLIAIGLLGAAALAGAYTLAGGVLPRVERFAGRAAVAAGAVAAAGVGLLILLTGPKL
ncbi:MAG TPA: copper resistance protein CopC [Candidatus Limnocylindrales bacterium]